MIVDISTWSDASANPNSVTLLSIDVASTFTSRGAMIVGKVVSITSICCSLTDWLPTISTTVQVTIVVPNSNKIGASLVMDMILVLSSALIKGTSIKLSFLVIASKVIESKFSITGEVVSTTVMIWVAEAELPEESVAFQVTIVSPSGNTVGASLVIVDISTWSDASANPNSVTLLSIDVASTFTSRGAMIVGKVVSIIEMIWVAEAELPEESVAVQVTIVSPSGNTSGASLVVDDISIISADSRIPIFTGLASWLIASCVIDSGAIRTGEVVSTTVMIWVAEAELPEESVAVQVTIVSPSGNTVGASLVSVVFWMSEITGNSSDMFAPPNILASSILSLIEISGTTESTKVILWDWDDELPEESVAVQVTIVSPSGNTVGASLVIVDISTSSDASGVTNSIWFLSKLDASIIWSSENEIRGAIESIIRIEWLIVETFPTTSVAVQVTIVSPSGNTSGASLVIDITPTWSDASGISNDTVFLVDDFASSEILPIDDICGGVESWIVTLWEAIAMLPDPSIAVQIIVFIPKGNDEGALLERE